MEIIQEKQIENLIKDGVIVATQEYLLRDGTGKQKTGDILRVSYGNWKSDRERLIRNEPPEIVNSVMAMWGDSPTLEDPNTMISSD